MPAWSHSARRGSRRFVFFMSLLMREVSSFSAGLSLRIPGIRVVLAFGCFFDGSLGLVCWLFFVFVLFSVLLFSCCFVAGSFKVSRKSGETTDGQLAA